MIDKTHTLPVTTQCRLLGLNRSTAYYRPKPTSAEADLPLMRRIDRIHMRYPFLGSRRIRARTRNRRIGDRQRPR